MSSSINKRGTHWFDCRCVLCLSFRETCKECGREFTTYPGYRAHVAAHKRKRDKESLGARLQTERIASRRRVVVPDNLGYLKTVVTDRDGLAAYNLGAVSRFAAIVNDLRPTKKRFTKGHKLLLKQLTGADAPAFVGLKCDLPKDQTISILQVALVCGVSPEDVLSLLVSYGIEHLATELRSGRSAPAPVDPTTSTPVRRSVIHPRTPHEEFLDQNFPEAAPLQKVTEVIEYHKPNPVKDSVQGLIPQREEEGKRDV